MMIGKQLHFFNDYSMSDRIGFLPQLLGDVFF